MSTPRLDDMLRLMDSIRAPRPMFDTVVLLPEIARDPLLIGKPGLIPDFHGMRVQESPLARMPARKHKRRRWMSEAYHRRIQKKWTKRFGTVPAAFLIDTRKLLDFPLLRSPYGDNHE